MIKKLSLACVGISLGLTACGAKSEPVTTVPPTAAATIAATTTSVLATTTTATAARKVSDAELANAPCEDLGLILTVLGGDPIKNAADIKAVSNEQVRKRCS